MGGVIARALGSHDAVGRLRQQYRDVSALQDLRSLRLRPDQFDEAIEVVSKALPIPNPHRVGKRAAAQILRAAYS
ncbi:hypothetical protein [Streptomyces sp. NPDC005181]|uniref:hypothetical protein n=1 Tax=Streptomyces sp. NPDC005181 TaxID=3156869 RepID=UPI00339EF954